MSTTENNLHLVRIRGEKRTKNATDFCSMIGNVILLHSLLMQTLITKPYIFIYFHCRFVSYRSSNKQPYFVFLYFFSLLLTFLYFLLLLAPVLKLPHTAAAGHVKVKASAAATTNNKKKKESRSQQTGRIILCALKP